MTRRRMPDHLCELYDVGLEENRSGQGSGGLDEERKAQGGLGVVGSSSQGEDGCDPVAGLFMMRPEHERRS